MPRNDKAMVAALRRAFEGSWARRTAWAWLLWPLSLLYGVLVATRRRLYQAGILRSGHVSVPVVVVGNVVAGGGGKTPMVLAIVRHLQARGIRVGVVSRGYGRRGTGCQEVLPHSIARDVGDEPLLISQAAGVAVFVAPRRADAARALLHRHPGIDLLVCDDGLQHLALQRDMEICVFGEAGIGNGFLLPAGPLREPWPRPVDLVVADRRSGVAGGWAVRRSLTGLACQADGTQLSLDTLRDIAATGTAGLWAVAGIARPQLFFSMLRDAGLPLTRTIALSDHAPFDDPVWRDPATPMLLCTEKDAVKLWHYRPDAWAVPLQLELDDAFWAQFDQILQACRDAKLSSAHGYKTA